MLIQVQVLIEVQVLLGVQVHFCFTGEAMEDKQEVVVSGLKMMLGEQNNKVSDQPLITDYMDYITDYIDYITD